MPCCMFYSSLFGCFWDWNRTRAITWVNFHISHLFIVAARGGKSVLSIFRHNNQLFPRMPLSWLLAWWQPRSNKQCLGKQRMNHSSVSLKLQASFSFPLSRRNWHFLVNLLNCYWVKKLKSQNKVSRCLCIYLHNLNNAMKVIILAIIFPCGQLSLKTARWF